MKSKKDGYETINQSSKDKQFNDEVPLVTIKYRLKKKSKALKVDYTENT